MKNMKNLKITLGTFASIALLAFTPSDDNGPMRYSVVHTEGNTVMVFDTTVADASVYSVDQFLADHGLSADNAEIFNLDEIQSMESRVLDSDVWLMHPGAIEESEMEVRIEKTIDDEGEEVVRKWVNGEEVEWDGEEIEMDGDNIVIQKFFHEGEMPEGMINIDSTQHLIQKTMMFIVDDKKGEKGEEIEIEVQVQDMDVQVETTIDEEGNEVTQVWINGEEVDPEQLEEMNGEGNVFIQIIEDDQNVMIEEFGEGGENVFVFETEVESNGPIGAQTIVFISSADEEGEGSKSMETPEVDSIIQDLKFMPNPSNGQFALQFNLTQKKRTQIDIHDMSGKLVYTENLGRFSGAYSDNIDISSEGPGTYILSITQGKERIVEKLIVR